ncbi:NLRC3 [Symbiodinium sp. CCMP2592]|nr:NLRC3 [Symbiodinium sp. CCMP2592]
MPACFFEMWAARWTCEQWLNSYPWLNKDFFAGLDRAYLASVDCTIKINLARNDIGDDGAKVLAEALKINRSVTEISLTRNNIGDDGAQALAGAIAINSSIVKVDLSFNSRIGEVGAQALEEVRQANSSVVCW